MFFRIFTYFLRCVRFLSMDWRKVQREQIREFRSVFEHARAHSPFYREFYRQAGVDTLKIRTMEDIQKVPYIDKAILRKHRPEELLTTEGTTGLLVTTTSGSTGEPYRLYRTRFEMLTSHVRIFVMYWKSGWRPWHRILMVNHYQPDSVFEGEKLMPWIRWLQKICPLFRRNIISIFNAPETVYQWMMGYPDAQVLVSTPSILDILCTYFEEHDVVRPFRLVVLASETLSDAQRGRFQKRFGNHIVGHYGLTECPTMGFDNGEKDEKRLFSESVLLELEASESENSGERGLKEGVVTNLVNRTMPIIRYRSHDLIRDTGRADCPTKQIGPICGRVDDILTLSGGDVLLHIRVYEMFNTLDCLQYKVVQYPDGHVALRLHVRGDADLEAVRAEALRRWDEHYPREKLSVEFVPLMNVSPKTGKFKNIEKLEG